MAGSIPVNLSNEPLALLDRRVGARQAVSGMADAWLAARTERPEMLSVEQGLLYPARVSDDGDLLVPATDVEHPEVIDDGALAAHDGVALTLRSRG